MKEPNVNGVAIRVGDVWEDRRGTEWRITLIEDEGDRMYPVEARGKNNPSESSCFTQGGTYSVAGSKPTRNLVKLISRDEPELPEDIADQFELSEAYRHPDAFNLLHVYEQYPGSERLEFTYYATSSDPEENAFTLFKATVGREPKDWVFRRKERWERGAFLTSYSPEANAVVVDGGVYEATHERNTVTGEIREIEK